MRLNYTEINTPCGKIKGISGEKCDEFRGIRYATAERFEYPKQVKSWDGIYDATEFGSCCYQHRAFDDDAVVNAFYHKEFRQGLSFEYSEDCLFLNIYAPKNAKNCPVLIYIHGGSFTGGSSNEGHLNGTELANNGIVAVLLNYRLGPYGFCSHPELANENGMTGNYGIYDQATAIQWVADNISAFGGDPEKITLMGQSAGAMSVDIHLSNCLVNKHIKGAIMLSGAGLQRFLLKPLTPEKTVPFWDKVIANAGVNSAKDLKTLEPKKLYYAWLDACKATTIEMPYTFPVYDELAIKKGFFDEKSIIDVPMIIGSTCTDMIPIVLQGVNKKWGRSVAHHRNPCYFYNFTRWLPGDDKGAWHASDLLYAFSTLDFNWRPFEAIDYEISNQLSKSIIAFAKTGNPNCPEIPNWVAGHKRTMHFCENTKMAKWDTAKNLKSTFTSKGMG